MRKASAMGNTDVRPSDTNDVIMHRGPSMCALWAMGCLVAAGWACSKSGGSSQRDATTDAVMLLGGTAGSTSPGGVGGTTLSGGTTGTGMGGNSGLDASAGGVGGLGGLPGSGGAPGTGGITSAGGTTATGGIQATGGIAASGGTSNVGGTQATGGTASTGGIKGTGGITTHDAAADVSQLINDAGNPICGDTLCGTAQYCCNSPCHQCMPSPDKCSSLVCGTADGGAFDSYPSDCTAAYSGDSTFCGTSATTPHSIHFYQCSTSVLALPCRMISVDATGGTFCCPGATY
jgi:hypothetical protein